MEQQPNIQQSSSRQTPPAVRKLRFFRHAEAAAAANPQPPSKRLKSIIPRHGLKSNLPRSFRTYEERYKSLFILSNQRKFWGKVEKTGSCWLWEACCAAHGYGQFSSNEVHILAHRYSYILANGPIDKGLHVHHKCEVPLCVNPAHLEALTPLQHRRKHLEAK